MKSNIEGAKQTPSDMDSVGVSSACSSQAAYLLSVERWPFHGGTTGSLMNRLSSLARSCQVSQSKAGLCHCTTAATKRFATVLSPPFARPPLLFRKATAPKSQTTNHTLSRIRITDRG